MHWCVLAKWLVITHQAGCSQRYAYSTRQSRTHLRDRSSSYPTCQWADSRGKSGMLSDMLGLWGGDSRWRWRNIRHVLISGMLDEASGIHRSYEDMCAAWPKFDDLRHGLVARTYETRRAEAGCGRMPFMRIHTPNAVQYRGGCTAVAHASGTSYSVLVFDRSVGWKWDYDRTHQDHRLGR
jgi:hypothetical protein